MRESGGILEQSYQGGGKIKGEIDKKLELAKAIAEFESSMQNSNDCVSETRSQEMVAAVDIDDMLQKREERMKPTAKENKILRDIFLALLFLVTLPTFVIPVAIILYWGHIYKDSNGEQKHDDDTGCNPSSSSIRYYNYY